MMLKFLHNSAKYTFQKSSVNVAAKIINWKYLASLLQGLKYFARISPKIAFCTNFEKSLQNMHFWSTRVVSYNIDIENIGFS